MKAARPAAPQMVPTAPSISGLLEQALEQHHAGHDGEAESIYRQALAIDPGHTAALNNLANLLLRAGRPDESLACCEKALAIDASYPLALTTKGLALQVLGRAAESIEPLRKAAEIKPDHMPARAGLASALTVSSHFEEAQEHFQAALDRSPDNAQLHADKGWVLRQLGQFEGAIDHLMQALALEPNHAQARDRLLLMLQSWHPPTYLPALDRVLLDCCAAPNVDPKWLARPLANQMWCKHVHAGGNDVTGAALAARILSDPLAKPLLTRTINCSSSFERVLVTSRRQCLLEGAGNPPGQEALVAISLLAQQAHNNGYVWWSEADEDQAVEELAEELSDTLAGEIQPDTAMELQLLRYAMYAPLSGLANAAALLAVSPDQLSAGTRALIETALREPLEEREIAQEIPALNAITDDVSREVQEQYEQNPYPRWLSVGQRSRVALDQYFRRVLPDFEPPGWMAKPFELLIAGCGTGRQTVLRALSYPDIRMTAVDLSRASLAYAIRMSRKFGIENIEHIQGDILELGRLGRRFRVIECAGVLHHMDDPIAGWSVLTDLLEPGGVMMIALYSEAARRHVVAARERVAALGLKPEPNDIRAFRQRIIKGDDGKDELLARLKSTSDFYDLHGCRDLIFHAREHRFTLPGLKRIIADQGLEFLGFVFEDPAPRMAYTREFPNDVSRTNLDNWAAFEQRYPRTFGGMYQFWCRKPD